MTTTEQIQAIEIDGKRYYQTPIGSLPSVNTVLDATESPEEVESLEAWRRKTKNHLEVRRQSLIRGQLLHERAEAYLEGQEPNEIDPSIELFWQSLLPYLQQVTRTAVIDHPLYGGMRKATELPVYHSLGYAGTLDWLGELRPLELTLADFKSSLWYKKPKYLVRYRLQIAAYRLAVQELLGLEIDHSDIVVAIPKYRYQLVRLTSEEVEEDNARWLERLAQFHASQSQEVCAA